MTYYPVFLDLKGKKAVVVGGGKVAERKILSLLKSGAVVTVISPSLTERLKKEDVRKTLLHIDRRYRKNDLKGAVLAVAATDSPEVNRQVAADAPALVNVVDLPSECNFIVPSVIKRGQLTIAISTGGTSPAISKAIRKEIEALYCAGFARYLRFIREIRARALTDLTDKKNREAFLKGLASEEIMKILRTKGPDAARKVVLSRFKAARR